MIIDTPKKIERYSLLALKGALELELVGLNRRGRSAYSIIKEEYGLKGNRKKVLDQLSQLIKGKQNEVYRQDRDGRSQDNHRR